MKRRLAVSSLAAAAMGVAQTAAPNIQLSEVYRSGVVFEPVRTAAPLSFGARIRSARLYLGNGGIDRRRILPLKI
jgi:hypothetical protein